MKRVRLLLTALALLFPRGIRADEERAYGLKVHEWGTFLTMSGSDGVTLDGMYHEEHALPAFVHSRAKDQVRLHTALTKGETPVIYFYTDRPQKVTVRVDFPGGVWTQWYPEAQYVGPSLTGSPTPPPTHKGHIQWSASIIPPREANNPALPSTSLEALWNYARQVDSAFVRTDSHTSDGSAAENERFLFYRGLGTVDMPLDVRFQGNGTVTLSASMPAPVRHLFVLRVENGRGAFKEIESLAPGASATNVIPSLEGASPLPEFAGEIAGRLARRLEESGLFAKEARAMANTWKNSYFGTEGIRVLYILPQDWTDRFIPMKVSPRPDSIVRVMVGRAELLTPERERRSLSAVRDLASPDSSIREKAYGFLRAQGRYAEPILRNVQRTTKDPTIRSLCSRLLLSDLATELRTATRAASDGSKVVEKPVFLRAQLASLLREIGLNEEARSEGRRTLSELDTISKPSDGSSAARHHLRAYARASEAMGDDRQAADWYARFIRFGSQTATCGNCHFEEGPRGMEWYRDWWAGKRYAQAVRRLGILESTIKEKQERVESNRGDTGSRMMLAYLLQEMGSDSQAASLWASIDAGAKRRAQVPRIPGIPDRVARTRDALDRSRANRPGH